ncbi:Abc transporter c family member 2, partial [Globisporangium splendens]
MTASPKADDYYVAVPPTPTQQQRPEVHRHDDESGALTKQKQKLGLAERYAQQPPFRARANPLQTASLASVVSTQWLQPLISLGAQKILEKDDIWAVDAEDACDTLYARFIRMYAPGDQQQQSGCWKLSRVGVALFRTFQKDFITVFVAYAIYIGTMSLQPYISQAILDFLNDRENVFHIRSGYVLVVMMTLVSFLGVTCLNYGVFILSRVGVNMRSVMMDIVYQKALRLSCVGRQAYTTGEIVTLMSVDSERIFNGVLTGPWLVIAPLAFVITIVLIALLFDVVSALCGAVLLVVVLVTSDRLAKRIGELQGELLTVVEERVKVTSEALQGIRVMKFYAWEDSLAQRVQKIRAKEIALYRKFHHYQIMNTTLLFLTPVLLGGLILGLYVLLRGNLTVTEVFTLIAMVNISRLAVNMFPLAIAAVSQLKITFERIDTYLTSDELPIEAIEDSEGHAMIEGSDHHPSSKGTISVRNAHFEWSRSTESMAVVVIPADNTDDHKVDIKKTMLEPDNHGFRLEGVNLEVDAGSLVMIVGKVGSGKSSLLNALLGEMIAIDGNVAIDGEISYVSQESWIRNSSVKDNILFESEFDADRYEKVLEATQLALDLYALPNGDQTEIGERGINLSGGQKARVAIARAMYRSKYDILVLDDPLSAVDPHVAHAIFDHCVVGLAKEKTRLLVLNSHYDLLIHADKILVVEDGRIAGDGTYDQIMAQFPELGAHSEELTSREQDVVDEHESIEDEKKKAHDAAMVLAAKAKAAASAIAKQHVLVSAGGEKTQASDGSGDPTKLIQEEDRVKGKVSGKTYMAYFNETGFNGFLVIAVLFASYGGSQGMRILVDWWQGHWAKNMDRDGVDPTYSGTWFGMWYFGFIVVCCVTTVARGILMIESCIRSSKNIHDDLFRRVLQAPVNRYFDVTPVGRILNRFSNDLDQLDANLPQQYQGLFQSVVLFLGCLVVCAMASFWVGLSYIPMLLVFVVTGLYFKKTSREVKRLEGITRTPVFNLFGETLNGLHTIRAFKMQDTFVRLNKDAVDVNASFYFTYWCTGRWLAVRLDWLSVVIIFVVTFYLVISKGQIDPVIAGISLTYSLMLTSMVQWVVRSLDTTDNAMTSVERLLHFRQIPAETDGNHCAPINPELWPSQGAIRFDKLCLKYRPELPLVLRGVNMDILGGEKVGICGRTGAGKSSLMIALFRICEFESGTVYIDGLDIQSVKLRDLRRSLAIIPQDPVLYSGSLRENLDPFGEYADDLIWSVLKQVHLFDSVTKWGAGLDFVVSERGDNLSVGQRQLLCIARALLKDSKIVVLDEATANVDTATDNLIQVTIKETFVNKTVLIIAHRINTIMHCDKIAVMDAGQVAEFGSPEALLSQSESIFASLAKRSKH